MKIKVLSSDTFYGTVFRLSDYERMFLHRGILTDIKLGERTTIRGREYQAEED